MVEDIRKIPIDIQWFLKLYESNEQTKLYQILFSNSKITEKLFNLENLSKIQKNSDYKPLISYMQYILGEADYVKAILQESSQLNFWEYLLLSIFLYSQQIKGLLQHDLHQNLMMH